jgi:hypothetical protein
MTLLRHPWRVLGVLLAVAAVTVGGTGVFASAFAQVSATQVVSSGTLATGAEPVAGTALGMSIDGMLPGETATRLLSVTPTGTIAAADVSLLVSGATNALASAVTVTVDQCSVAWSATATCAGTTTTAVSATSATALVGRGAVVLARTVVPGQTVNLRIRISLPAGTFTTTDGVSAAPYMGQALDLDWSIRLAQAAATTTSS